MSFFVTCESPVEEPEVTFSRSLQRDAVPQAEWKEGKGEWGKDEERMKPLLVLPKASAR